MSGDYRPSQEASSRRPVIELPSTSSRSPKRRHRPLSGTDRTLTVAGSVSGPGPSMANTSPSQAPNALIDDRQRAIRLTETDASEENWPKGYILDVPSSTTRPFVRLDHKEVGESDPRVPPREWERREKKTEEWLIAVGSHIGNRRTGATEGSPEWIQYRLDGFPPHYALFEQSRRRGIVTSGQRDTYLCGWTKRFRSPHEFFEHAWWLYNAKQGKCKCKYCSPKEWIPPSKTKLIKFPIIDGRSRSA